MLGKILLIFSLFVAQLTVVSHVDDGLLLDDDCIYCQVATEFSGTDVPSEVEFNLAVFNWKKIIFSSITNVVYPNIYYKYNTRAPPFA